jgi:hypothetical protein
MPKSLAGFSHTATNGKSDSHFFVELIPKPKISHKVLWLLWCSLFTKNLAFYGVLWVYGSMAEAAAAATQRQQAGKSSEPGCRVLSAAAATLLPSLCCCFSGCGANVESCSTTMSMARRIALSSAADAPLVLLLFDEPSRANCC